MSNFTKLATAAANNIGTTSAWVKLQDGQYIEVHPTGEFLVRKVAFIDNKPVNEAEAPLGASIQTRFALEVVVLADNKPIGIKVMELPAIPATEISQVMVADPTAIVKIGREVVKGRSIYTVIKNTAETFDAAARKAMKAMRRIDLNRLYGIAA